MTTEKTIAMLLALLLTVGGAIWAWRGLQAQPVPHARGGA
jgi:hypothetical protein